MATIFDLEQETETVKAVPPHKFWRAVWHSPKGFSEFGFRLRSYFLDKFTVVTGPIFPTAEMAEQSNLAMESRVLRKRPDYSGRFVRVIKVNENGEPI